jgi:hypothetical protein
MSSNNLSIIADTLQVSRPRIQHNTGRDIKIPSLDTEMTCWRRIKSNFEGNISLNNKNLVYFPERILIIWGQSPKMYLQDSCHSFSYNQKWLSTLPNRYIVNCQGESWGKFYQPNVWFNLIYTNAMGWFEQVENSKFMQIRLACWWQIDHWTFNEEPAKLNRDVALRAVWPNSLFSNVVFS